MLPGECVMTCADGKAWATAQEFYSFWNLNCMDNNAQMLLEVILETTASDIHVAMAASGQCDCTLAAWAANYLKKLNIVDAAVMYMNPCGPQFTADERRLFMDWINAQLEAIRTGKLELCVGETGSEFPAIDWAEQGTTEFAQAKIIVNDMLKNG